MGAVFTIDLRRLERGPVDVRGAIAADDPVWGDTGVKPVSAVQCEARAEGSWTRGVRVRGGLSGRVRCECRRCLEPVELNVQDEIDLLFDPKTMKIEEDMRVYALDPGAEELDLKTPLRERFILAVPSYPLCHSECKGLCARCGTNLNVASCDCASVGTDPRWGPLAELRKAN